MTGPNIANDCREIAVLWPKLLLALPRDRTTASTDVTSSAAHRGVVSNSLVNSEVQTAIHVIGDGLEATHTQIVALLHVQRRPLEPVAILGQLPNWYQALQIRGAPLASHIETDVPRWRSLARRGIGLNAPDRPLRHRCPYHRDEPAFLAVKGDRAELHDGVLSGNEYHRVRDRAEAAVRWRPSDTIVCRLCRREWAGITELRLLGKMLEQTGAQ